MAELVRILRSALGGIESELTALDAKTRDLRADWSGEAAYAYTRAHGEWRATLARLTGILEDATGSAERAVERHLEARTAVARLWS